MGRGLAAERGAGRCRIPASVALAAAQVYCPFGDGRAGNRSSAIADRTNLG